MPVEVTLFYRRDDGAMTSTGHIESRESGMTTEEGSFESIEWKPMLTRVCQVLGFWPVDTPVDVVFQRTDREGLSPYKLDVKTVQLLRTDPVAGIAALTFTGSSPSTIEKRTKEERAAPAPLLRAGQATLVDAFGDQLFFRVRKNELECPGCGLWGVFAMLGVLNDPDRAGSEFKVIYACRARCHQRFPVTCLEKWGHVRTEYLLEQTTLDAFFFPRAWNNGQPWVTRAELTARYQQYKEEKEKVE